MDNPTVTSSGRWRGERITPSSYDSIPGLVVLAKRARNQVIDFEWVFTREDLESLRRAVHAWGSPVSGRYKAFDAKVLASINEALNEPHCPWVLKQPKGADLSDCSVVCVEEQGVFRVRGHASFDLVFGYGNGAADEKGRGWSHLTEAARRTLVQSVSELGWDVRLLSKEGFRAVRNVIFGMSPSYGIGTGQRSPEPAEEVAIHFHGPFTVTGDATSPCLFTSELGSKWGIYLWTVNVGGEERPWYVGQTNRSFASRMAEHIAGMLSGQYSVFDAGALARGELRRTGPSGVRWPDAVPALVRDYDAWGPHAIATVRLLRFFVAPLTEERLLDRVEGAIGRYYQGPDAPAHLRSFFYPGLRVPAVVPFDRAIRLTASSDAPLAGLDNPIED